MDFRHDEHRQDSTFPRCVEVVAEAEAGSEGSFDEFRGDEGGVTDLVVHGLELAGLSVWVGDHDESVLE